MSRNHLVIPDSHAHPNYHNKRAELVGHLINDLKPDVVINLGDTADMPSLSSYDKGTKGFIGRNYISDINAHNDWQDRLWTIVKRQKKRLPERHTLEGNHEYRIKRVINSSPELEGAVSFNDLQLDSYYDNTVEYEGHTPGIVNIDGIHYAHYMVSGVMGRPIGGEHPAFSLLTKQYSSCTVGHIHTADLCYRTNADGQKIIGMSAGCFLDYEADWAGEVNKLWWAGVVHCRGVENGTYDPEFISLKQLQKEYKNV